MEDAIKTSVAGTHDGVSGNGVKNPFGLYSGHKMPDGISEENKDGRFLYTFVRHPIAWYKSFWCFRIKARDGAGYATIKPGRFVLDRYWSPKWDEFVDNVLEGYPDGFVNKLYRAYVGDNCEKVNFIGKQENLANDLVKALTLAGEDFDEKKLRATKRVNVAAGLKKYGKLCKLSKKLEKKILDKERWVIERFYG